MSTLHLKIMHAYSHKNMAKEMPDVTCHMACTPPGQSRQLFKADA